MEKYRFQRSQYCDGMRLTAADLQNQQEYDRSKRELLVQSLFGSGIVRGLLVENLPQRNELLVHPGLAVDPLGRTLCLPDLLRIPYARLFRQMPTYGDRWHLCIGYTERLCGEGRMLRMEDGLHLPVENRVEEGVRFSASMQPGEDEVVIAVLAAGIQSDRPFVWSVEPVGPAHSLRGQRPATGCLRLSPAELRPGNLLYSQEVSHGLGPGDVRVSLAVEGWQGGRQCTISGAIGLFRLELELAVKVFPESGSFIAAARVPDGWDRDLRLRWYAEACGAVFSEEKPPATAAV